MTFRNLSIEWDEVLIIDLLSDAERSTYQISEETRNLLATNGVQQLQMSCSLKRHVFEALSIAQSRTANKNFMIHFTAHGCSSGIGNNSGLDLVTWSELRDPLAKINSALCGNLIVNMISCKGIEGLKIDDLMDPSDPFYALIGPTRSLGFDEARALCIMFYTKLLTNPEIPSIISEINTEFQENILWGRSSQILRSNPMS